MSFIGLPSLAMLLVLANVALCLTAESQKRGLLDLTPPTSFAAIPLSGSARPIYAPAATLAAQRE